jgi:hypothetical protein
MITTLEIPKVPAVLMGIPRRLPAPWDLDANPYRFLKGGVPTKSINVK